jgi:DNA-binding CsgD family transcriptional regulator
VGNLRAAAALYDSLPAPWLRDRALAELRSLGPEGRRAAQRVGALTAREREVATLAARGLPTIQIAARLHVSRRTVESHLDRVYRKLGIDGRRRLAEALEAEGQRVPEGDPPA